MDFIRACKAIEDHSRIHMTIDVGFQSTKFSLQFLVPVTVFCRITVSKPS